MTTRSTSLFVLSLVFFAGCNKVICTDTEEKRGETCVPIDIDTDDNSPALISVDPCEIEFGAVSVNTTTSQTIKILNDGGQELLVSSIVLTEPFNSPASAATISGHSQYQFAVRFSPVTYGDFTGTLTITASNEDVAPKVCALHGSVLGDVDGDGYIGAEGGGDDCDDNDPSAYPGATEVWYNGVDENCDGMSDFDQDADGYESAVYNPLAVDGGGDCQDNKAAINPGVTEIYYDGVDQNCDGVNDYDADADGEKSSEYGGTDCNDLDPAANSEGIEIYDGIDNNCDGTIDNGVENTEDDVTITGSDITQSAGSALALGDWDDDGTVELAVGMEYYNWSSTGKPDGKGDSGGAVAVFLTTELIDGNMTDSAGIFIEGENDVDEVGAALANVGDVDEDGIIDLAIGASSRGDKRDGAVYLMSGPNVADGDITSAFAILNGEEGYRFGSAISSNVDIDADGTGDIMAFGIDTYYGYNYAALQYGGSDVTGEIAWVDIDSTYRGKCSEIGKGTTADHCEGTSATMGGSIYWPTNGGSKADFNGDGYDDILMADPYYDMDDGSTGAANHGRVYTLLGRSSRYSASSASIDGSAVTLFTGTGHKQYLGKSVGVVPDSGSGTNGVLVTDADTGVIYYFEGSDALVRGGLDLVADATAYFDSNDDFNGFVNVGDWTGDSMDDMAALSSDGGYVALLDPAGWAGGMGDIDANGKVIATIVGATDYKSFGAAAPAFAGDLDGDTLFDLVVSDWQYDDDRGSVHIFYNPN